MNENPEGLVLARFHVNRPIDRRQGVRPEIADAGRIGGMVDKMVVDPQNANRLGADQAAAADLAKRRGGRLEPLEVCLGPQDDLDRFPVIAGRGQPGGLARDGWQGPCPRDFAGRLAPPDGGAVAAPAKQLAVVGAVVVGHLESQSGPNHARRRGGARQAKLHHMLAGLAAGQVDIEGLQKPGPDLHLVRRQVHGRAILQAGLAAEDHPCRTSAGVSHHRLQSGANPVGRVAEQQLLQAEIAPRGLKLGVERLARPVRGRPIECALHFHPIDLEGAFALSAKPQQDRLGGEHRGRQFALGTAEPALFNHRLPGVAVGTDLGQARAADVVVHVQSNPAILETATRHFEPVDDFAAG